MTRARFLPVSRFNRLTGFRSTSLPPLQKEEMKEIEGTASKLEAWKKDKVLQKEEKLEQNVRTTSRLTDAQDF